MFFFVCCKFEKPSKIWKLWHQQMEERELVQIFCDGQRGRKTEEGELPIFRVRWKFNKNAKYVGLNYISSFNAQKNWVSWMVNLAVKIEGEDKKENSWRLLFSLLTRIGKYIHAMCNFFLLKFWFESVNVMGEGQGERREKMCTYVRRYILHDTSWSLHWYHGLHPPQDIMLVSSAKILRSKMWALWTYQ